MMICGRCGYRVSDKAAYCTACGASLEEFGKQDEKQVEKRGNKGKKIVIRIFVAVLVTALLFFLAYRNGFLLEQNERYVLKAARTARAQTEFPDTFEICNAYVKSETTEGSNRVASVCLVYSSLEELDEQEKTAFVEFTFSLITIDKYGRCSYRDEESVRQEAYENSSDSENVDSIARGAVLVFEMSLGEVMRDGVEVETDKISQML